MALNLVKLCVGVSEMSEMKAWIHEAKGGRDTLDHTTRMWPRREADILPGGSLYWVIRGLILCRQPIASFERVKGGDGIDRCRIVFKAKLVQVRPTPRRAFQGWRYLEAEDAPPDLAKGAKDEGMPERLRKDLAELGLL